MFLLQPGMRFHFSESVLPASVFSVLSLRGLFVVIFLQMGPRQSNTRIFLLTTPNEVIPKPTSSNHQALALIQPL